jgi:hypothetical protein
MMDYDGLKGKVIVAGELYSPQAVAVDSVNRLEETCVKLTLIFLCSYVGMIVKKPV